MRMKLLSGNTEGDAEAVCGIQFLLALKNLNYENADVSGRSIETASDSGEKTIKKTVDKIVGLMVLHPQITTKEIEGDESIPDSRFCYDGYFYSGWK